MRVSYLCEQVKVLKCKYAWKMTEKEEVDIERYETHIQTLNEKLADVDGKLESLSSSQVGIKL